MKIMSWNVNGIRACHNKGCLTSFLETHEPDIIGLQETKISPDQLPEELQSPGGYHAVWHSGVRRGYSGVAILTKRKPLNVIEGFGIPKFDQEGRVISADYGDFIFFSVYFPNGQMNEDRLAYKLEFYHRFFDYCNELRKEGRRVIIAGDYNTAHKEIDLARPKENENYSGFLPIERAWMDRVVEMGYTDTFRMFHPEPGQYSWWTFRAGARQRNVGWRIDYVFVDNEFSPNIKEAYILPEVMGSDHCPVGIEI
ncbi:exodeoxyribonuclease III [bacterium]|nr:exodeoxyribonuclease III [bacterium]